MDHKHALRRLTARLIARRDAVRRMLDDDLDSFRRDSSEVSGVGDNIDAAVDSATDEICSQLVELESRELGQVQHALHRIAVGVYGRCESCGGKISAARLNALPYTNRCIDCQRANERGGRRAVLEPDSTRWEYIDETPFEEGDAQTDLRDVQIELGESRGWAHGSPFVSFASHRS
ncbi:MAG: TraR/DksA family transcriptional regulator [Isosphaerales bacterium]